MRHKLVDINGDNPIWYCNSCSIEVLSSEIELRSKSQQKTPDGPIENPHTSYRPESELRKKEVEYKEAFTQLAKHSTVRPIDYTETRGGGKILRRKRSNKERLRLSKPSVR